VAQSAFDDATYGDRWGFDKFATDTVVYDALKSVLTGGYDFGGCQTISGDAFCVFTPGCLTPPVCPPLTGATIILKLQRQPTGAYLVRRAYVSPPGPDLYQLVTEAATPPAAESALAQFRAYASRDATDSAIAFLQAATAAGAPRVTIAIATLKEARAWIGDGLTQTGAIEYIPGRQPPPPQPSGRFTTNVDSMFVAQRYLAIARAGVDSDDAQIMRQHIATLSAVAWYTLADALITESNGAPTCEALTVARAAYDSATTALTGVSSWYDTVALRAVRDALPKQTKDAAQLTKQVCGPQRSPA